MIDYETTRQLDNESTRQQDNEIMERCIENLFIWNESRKVVNRIYFMMQNSRDYGFKDQIQRASVSIMNNIAEGFESGSDAKFINFLNIAKGSCSEVKSMLYLCEDFKYCSSEERIEIQYQVKQISIGIKRLIDSLQKNNL